ncbi:MAG TPA: sigma-70 family RNA polymerase sigma factor [archaeon]|nr:sigma-70 family RNA polymerase sigma factor [archaeon]
MPRNRPISKKAVAFAKALETNRPANSADLRELAEFHGLSISHARALAGKKGISFRMYSLLRTDMQRKGEVVLAQRVLRVFDKRKGLFKIYCKKYIRMEIPFEYLRDYCIDASIRAARKYTFGTGMPFEAWITNGWAKIQLRNAKRRWFKVKRRTRQFSSFEGKESRNNTIGTIVSREPEPWIKQANAEERQRLYAALKSLPEMEMKVIKNRFGIGTERLTSEQTAKALKISSRSVYTLEKRAREKLRESLKE